MHDLLKNQDHREVAEFVWSSGDDFYRAFNSVKEAIEEFHRLDEKKQYCEELENIYTNLGGYEYTIASEKSQGLIRSIRNRALSKHAY